MKPKILVTWLAGAFVAATLQGSRLPDAADLDDARVAQAQMNVALRAGSGADREETMPPFDAATA